MFLKNIITGRVVAHYFMVRKKYLEDKKELMKKMYNNYFSRNKHMMLLNFLNKMG